MTNSTSPNPPTLIFATGNPRKSSEAARAAKQYGIILEARDLQIPEIQSNNPLAVAEAKVKSAYQILQSPVVTHDSSWSIPALNGFPGVYMHDMIHWFEPSDWLNLINGHSDRSAEVCETVTFYDGQHLQTFQYRRQGTFADAPRGIDGNSVEKVIILDDDRTIAEHYDAGITDNGFNLKIWHDFFTWYQKH